MSELGDAIVEVRNELAAEAEGFMPDLCDLIKETFVEGGATGDSKQPSAIATDIPCSFRSLGQNNQLVVGGVTYTATHEIEMPFTDETALITPEYRISLTPGNGDAVKIFQQPVIRDESMSALVVIAATEVRQGFQQR